MRTRPFSLALGIAAALAAAPTAARAQLFDLRQPAPQRPPRFFGGIEGIYAVPQREFGRYVDHGWGISGYLLAAVDQRGALALRLDGGFLNYGNEKKRACINSTIGCRIDVDVETSNNIAFVGVGPQLMVPNGRFRPYVNGTVGYSYFFTESSLEGSNSGVSFTRTTNYDDGVLSTAAGAGVYVPLRAGRTPISIDLGARYRWNGKTRYLREGSIVDFPDGSIEITPIESRTDFVTYQLGVTIGGG
ncbi:MAG: hypothetical protein ACJ79S_15100 [Gemmatimonadaceae bacterium]